MKNFEKFEIIDKARLNRENREGPWEFFHRKIDLLRELTTSIDEKIEKEDLLLEARKQHINGLVTALEAFLKEVFRILVDENQLKCDNILDKERKYSLLDFKIMMEKKYTYGEILSNNYNFQNLGDVGRAFDEILGIRIFEELKKFKVQAGKEEFSAYIDFYELLEQMLSLRHDFIHDINFNYRLSTEDVINYHNNVHRFVDILTYFLNDFINKNKEKFGKPSNIANLN